MKAAEAALLELHALHGIEFADIPHVLLVPPGLLQPLDVVVVRLRVLNPAEDGLVLVCDLLELPLAALTVQRGMALSPLSPHAGAVGSDSDSCGSLHAGALVPLHDVRHLLEEQAVLALDGGVALLQQRLLLSIALQMTLRRGRLVVDGALHVPQLALVILLHLLNVSLVASLVADRHRPPSAIHCDATSSTCEAAAVPRRATGAPCAFAAA
mmetsp:Transcript_21633/g.66213  ORF Transcript_21633/g.66213 Transcript_21633/m.66213 type:complete len:212 (-) Transcript_21633:317-952(-)